MKNLITSLLSFVIVFTCYSPSYSNKMEFNIGSRRVINIPIEKNQNQARVGCILATLRSIESDWNYSAEGQSGEYGAYQFTKKTWEMYCLKYFNKILPIENPKYQDQIAQKAIINLIEKGYSNEQIASIWNSGSPRWEGKEGINRFGVQYSAPKYVIKFMFVYNKINGKLM